MNRWKPVSRQTNRSRMVRVTISEEACARADREAKRDTDRAERNPHWVRVGGSVRGEDRHRFRVGSYRAEEAVAQLLGVTFVRNPDGFGEADVAGYSVRFGTQPGYGLAVYTRDKGHPYILACPASRKLSLSFDVIGWLTHVEAFDLVAKDCAWKRTDTTTEGWLIRQGNLTPAHTIPKHGGLACPRPRF